MTHVRDELFIEYGDGRMVWRACCGIKNPPSSVSLKHFREHQDHIERLDRYVEPICQTCRDIVNRG